MSEQSTTIFIFSSITGITQSLREADSTLPLQEIKDDALDGYGGTVEFDPTKLEKDTLIQLKQAVILISEPFVVAKLLEYDQDALSSLSWCFSTYAGIDPIFKSSKISFPLHFKLTRFAGCFGPPIAEWCISHIIGHERGFKASAKDQLQKSWAGSKEKILHYRYLSSLTLSILGCGDIGCCIAKAAKAFNMKTIGFGKTDRDYQIDGIDEYTTNLKYALQSADYIVSVLPSTLETRGLLNGKTLQQASISNGGKCPAFLNVGRGDVISEGSILHALDKEYISAAILDVFEVEPLPIDSPLWSRSDVVISPHVSGLTQCSDVPKIFLENYSRYKNGRNLKYVVDWNKGY